MGLAKKTNREGNEHNFGRLMIAMGLLVNVSKAQAHTFAKKYTKKAKLANVHWYNTPFYIKKSKH